MGDVVFQDLISCKCKVIKYSVSIGYALSFQTLWDPVRLGGKRTTVAVAKTIFIVSNYQLR